MTPPHHKGRKKRKVEFESCILVEVNEKNKPIQWLEINGDGFLLEGRMHEMRSRYPTRRFEIFACEIKVKKT